MTQRDKSIELPSDLAACQALLLQSRKEAQQSRKEAVKHAQESQRLQGEIQSQQALLAAKNVATDELLTKIRSLETEKEDLNLKLKALLQERFRRRSERYLSDPRQLILDFGESPDIEDAATGLQDAAEEAEQLIKEHTRRPRKRKSGDQKFPEHLPRVIREVPVSETDRVCAVHGERIIIGYDEVESMKLKPPELYVEVLRYPKLACKEHRDCGIKSPERRVGVVEGNRFDASVAAYVITCKLGFHLPYYRQQDLFASVGWTPSRSTLVGISEGSHFVLENLIERVAQRVLSDCIVGTDDTTTTLIVPKRPVSLAEGASQRDRLTYEVLRRAQDENQKSITARFWAYRSISVPLVFFDFTVSRHRDGPASILSDYRGTLLADCYSGYESIASQSGGQIVRAACNAHARRKVFKALDNYPHEAAQLFALYSQLYDVESRSKDYSADERQALRMRAAAPIWKQIQSWLESPAARSVTPKSKLGEAITYLRNHWDALQVYLGDGQLPIDNNDVEQLMRQIALGRKNWLFVGSAKSGARLAGLVSLVASAVRNDLDVWAYLTDVIQRLLDGETDLDSLCPDVWRQSHPEAIRKYREDERRDAADRKKLRRAKRRIERAAQADPQ